MEGKKLKISMDSVVGAKKLLAICLVAMLVFSIIGTCIYTNGGKVKMEELVIDARGAQIAADLYYPVGASDKDSLPCVVIMPGAASNKHGTRMISEELAKRGIVALNCDGYGQGESEQPKFTESGYGEGNWWKQGSSDIDGMLDCVNFVRTLQFVDPTRIGVSGHSWGAWRSNQTVIADCGYYTLNDMMMNILYDEFGVALTEEEITQDAAEVAAKYLNEDQMVYFNYLFEEKEEEYNSKILAACLIGNPGTFARAQQIVQVAGYDVSRSCQTNLSWAIGLYDHNTLWWTKDDAIASFYENEVISLNEYYSLDDNTATFEKLGAFYDTSVASSTALQDAFSNRSVRVVTPDNVTHTGEIYTCDSVANIVEFFCQVFNQNNGALGAVGSNPIPTTKIVGLYRWYCCYAMYFLAFLSMLAFVVILINKVEFFTPLKLADGEIAPTRKLPKKWVWIFAGMTVLLTMLTIVIMIRKRPFTFPPQTQFFVIGKAQQIYFIPYMAICSLVGVIIMVLVNKKLNGDLGLKEMIAAKPVIILKSALAAIVTIAFMYWLSEVVRDAFHLNIGFIQSLLPHMKAEHWEWAARYALVFLPCTFIINISANYTKSGDLRSEQLDAFRAALVNLLPIVILYIIESIHRVTYADGSYLINFESMYSFFTMIPIVMYTSKRFYDKTGNIWFGTFFHAIFLAWGNVGTLEYGSGIYVGQTFISTFLGR